MRPLAQAQKFESKEKNQPVDLLFAAKLALIALKRAEMYAPGCAVDVIALLAPAIERAESQTNKSKNRHEISNY